MAHKVDEYRAAHPRETAIDAMEATGWDMSTSQYYVYRKKLEGEPLKHNGADHGSGESVEFPLAIIPARPVTKKKKEARPVIVAHDQDKALAAQLLEVAAALLRR